MQDKNFIAYEYKTVTVAAKNRARETDIAEAFGWEAIDASKAIGDNYALTFRRDRKIAHRAELTRLEKRAKDASDTLKVLEKSKTRAATVFGWIFGIASTLIAGGGMSLVMQSEGVAAKMAAGIVLGIAGIALCCVNYPIYNKIALKKTTEVAPSIDAGEEALANILEQGNDLLAHKEI